VYATVAELRAEGVTEAQADDARLEALLDAATSEIDRLTGWFFEPRGATLTLDGRGTPSLELPVPPIRLDRVRAGGGEISTDPEHLIVVGAPVGPGFDAPRLTRRFGRFPRGAGNVVVEGLFGYTEPDGTPERRTPPSIRRACILLVLRWLHPLAGDGGFDARNRWRIIEERTRDQSYKLDRPGSSRGPTGDPELDAILLRYRRPAPMGAA
jgi:hypothetical protein